jgi:hypothetical protein
MYEYKQTPGLDLELLESPTGENFVYGETQCKVHVFFYATDSLPLDENPYR